ncbi:MAG: hypothetical protein RID09_04150 [Coleofasciculus sp. G1-WW12-02]|uniref:hypothetical protein n=1 Tax=Coleofasciculus sp. G1-WW12-02 TaxID=3068483 RepID=UPI0032F9CE55
MAAEARAVRFQLGNIEVSGYQLTSDQDQRLLFTHRQIAEVVGKSKGTAQKFCKSNENNLPETVKAVVPDKPRPIALSSWDAAVAFWQHQAHGGNETATALVEAANSIPLETLQIKTASDIEPDNPPYPKDIEAAIAELPQTDEFPLDNQLQQLDQGLRLIAKWLEEAGLDQRAIASWKLNVLTQRFPALASAANQAQQLLVTHSVEEPSGMIASQVAEKVSEQLGRKVKAAQVNAALHELGIQEWTKPGSRERRLTEKGKAYGRALLATSKTNAWSGAQLRWFDNVVPLLCEYFAASQ